jgi:hypothetical protein
MIDDKMKQKSKNSAMNKIQSQPLVVRPVQQNNIQSQPLVVRPVQQFKSRNRSAKQATHVSTQMQRQNIIALRNKHRTKHKYHN